MAEVTSPEVQKYSTLVKLQPENPEAHFRLGFAHEDAGNTAEAVKHYETAIKLQPRHAMSYLHRGFLFAKGGETNLALQEWSKAFEYDPFLHNKFSTPELRPVYKKKFDTAIQQLERPIVINPKDAFARYQLGTAYKYFQKPELALQSLKRALDINPDLWEAHYQCGEIFAQLNQNKLAINSFQRAIDGNSRYADSHYELGLIYEKENMSALALRHVERAIELDPEVSKYHFALGRIFMKQTKYKRAMKQYQKALDLDPTDARIHLRLAECCKQMYRPDLAIHCYEKAVELDPDSSEAVYELGTTALQLGDIDRAIKGFQKALEINGQDAYAHYSLAQAYHRQKDFEAAATHYGESARLNPKDAFAAYNLGLMRDELNQPEQAIEAYRKAVELKPHDAQYHLNLGRAYLKAKRPQEAASELKQAIKLNPNDLETNFFLADVHMEQGQFDEAINLYRKVVDLNPESVEARYRMAQAFNTLDMPDYAFEAFQETVRLDPRHFEALHGLGQIYLTARRKPSIAVDFFQQALDVEPSFAPSMVSLGDAYMELGQPDRALQFFERKLEENRESVVFVSKYCLALANSGHADKAAEEIRVALQLNPESIDLRRTHAQLLEKQNRTQDALDAWRTAVRLDEDNIQSLLGFGKALQAAGSEDEAKAQFQRILSINAGHEEARERLAALTPYDPTAGEAPLPVATPAPAAPSEPESTDPFDFIGQDAASDPAEQSEPEAAPSEDPFAAAVSEPPTTEPEPVNPFDEVATAPPAPEPVSQPVDDPFASSEAPAESADVTPSAPDVGAEGNDPFASTSPVEAVPPTTDDPFAAATPAPAPEETAPSGEDPFATAPPTEAPAPPTSEDPFAAAEPAPATEETTPAAEDPFAAAEPAPATEETAPAAEDPFAAAEPAPAPEETAPAAEDPFAAAEPAPAPEETASAAEDPFAAAAPAPATEETAPAAEDPFAAPEPAPAPEETAPAAEETAEAAATEEPTTTVAAEETAAEPATESQGESAESTEEPVEAPTPTEEPVSAAPEADPDFSAEEVLQQAILANVTGQASEAESLFDSILAKAPNYTPVYFHFGQYLRGKGATDRAVELFQAGLSKAQEQNEEDLAQQLTNELNITTGGTEAAAAPAAEETVSTEEESAPETEEATPTAEEAVPADDATPEVDAPAQEASPEAEVAEEEAPAPPEDETKQPTLAEQLTSLEESKSYEAAWALWENSEEKPADFGQRIALGQAEVHKEAGELEQAVQWVEKLLSHQSDNEEAKNKVVSLTQERADKFAEEQKFDDAITLLSEQSEKLEDETSLQASVLGIKRKKRDHLLAENSDEGLALARELASEGEEDKTAYLNAVKSSAEALADEDPEKAVALVDSEKENEGAPEGLSEIAVSLLLAAAQKAKESEELEKAKELAGKILERDGEHAEAKALLEEATAAETPAWKEAEENGDLTKALAEVPDDEEHEADRHRLYKAQVEKQKESSLSDAVNTAQDWKSKVSGEENKSEATETLQSLLITQSEQLEGEELVAALDSLKETGVDEEAWTTKVVESASRLKDADAGQAKLLLLKIDPSSADQSSKENALGVWTSIGRSALEESKLEDAQEAVAAAQELGGSDDITALQNELVVKQVEKALEENNFEEALTLLDHSSLEQEAKEPLKIQALLGQVEQAKEEGNDETVNALFEQLKELAPEHEAVVAHFESEEKAGAEGGGDGETLTLPEDQDEALDLLKERLTANATDSAALAAAYERFGTKANARKLIDLFRELQKKNTDDPRYLLSLARAYSHVGKDTLAVVQFRKLLSNDPQPEVFLDLTRAYRRLKKMADASKTLDQALNALPDHPGPKKEQVVILSMNEEHSAAEQAAQEGLKLPGLSDEDRAWFEKAVEATGAGNELPEELTEIPTGH